MAITSTPDKSKDNSVRRVLKQGLYHICGMCGKRYGNEAQAEACLKNCISRYMAQQAVQDKSEKAGTVYRCTYCKRVYDKMILAKECAKVCKNEIQKKIELESRYKNSQTREEKLKNLAAFASGDPNITIPKPTARPENRPEAKTTSKPAAARPAAPSKPAAPKERAPALETAELEEGETSAPPPVHPAEGTKFSREGHSYKCQTCHQKYKKFQEAMACFDRHREQEKAGVAKKPEKDDRFYRDAAKYVCKKCNSKYFSKSEVIACFEGHKDDPEVYVTGPAAPKVVESSVNVSKETLEASRNKRAIARSAEEKFFRDGAKYVCRICNKKLFTKGEVIQCYDGHAAEASGEEATSDTGPSLTSEDLAAVVIEKTMKEVKTGRNRDGEDKFFRDGAKYVCKKCNTRHFTRGEVIACYDKH